MILIAKVNPKVSYVWQSVIKARDALLDGFSLPLDDSQTSFWYSNWIVDGKQCMKIPYVHMLIKILMQPISGWMALET